MDRAVEIAVVGATGTVGRELLNALQERGHPPERVTALASERSEGKEVDFGDETLEVERATPEALRGRKLVLLAAHPEVARPLGEAAQASGAWVVDLSRAFAGQPQVPMVLPSVNLARLRSPFSGRIVRCPSALATAALTVLEPLRRSFGLRQGALTALLAASVEGVRGVQALESQTAALLSGRELEEGPFPHRLAFNVIPQVGMFQGGLSGEERAWQEDAAAIWDGQNLVGCLAIQVPNFFGHALSLTFQLERESSLEAVREAWRGTPTLKLLDDPLERIYPMPSLVTGDPAVLVGRLQALPSSGWFSCFAAIDNARRGGALNALDVGDVLMGLR